MVEKFGPVDEKVLTRIHVDRGCIIVGDGLSGLGACRRIALIEIPDASKMMLFGKNLPW